MRGAEHEASQESGRNQSEGRQRNSGMQDRGRGGVSGNIDTRAIIIDAGPRHLDDPGKLSFQALFELQSRADKAKAAEEARIMAVQAERERFAKAKVEAESRNAVYGQVVMDLMMVDSYMRQYDLMNNRYDYSNYMGRSPWSSNGWQNQGNQEWLFSSNEGAVNDTNDQETAWDLSQ